MDPDEELARKLQAEFDAELEGSEQQIALDRDFADKIASAVHNISDSESDQETENILNNIRDATCTSNGDSFDDNKKNSSNHNEVEHQLSESDEEITERPSTNVNMGKEQDKPYSDNSQAVKPQSYLQNVIKDFGKSKGKKRPACKYGTTCFRKNPIHLAEFYHPNENKRESTPIKEPSYKKAKIEEESPMNAKSIQSSSNKLKPNIMPSTSSKANQSSNIRKKSFLERHKESAPYHFFLNKIASVKDTEKDPLTLVFPDLISPMFGEIVESAQLSFVVDLDYVQSVYKAMKVGDKPLLIMYGDISDLSIKESNVTCVEVKLPFLYGTHHTKMMLIEYKAGLRVVIHTANLTIDDWCEKTQGFWVSPLFPPLDNGKCGLLEGESETGFKKDLVEYLLSYKSPDLTRWSHIIRKFDFSKCNVVFIGSAPGYHTGPSKDKWGHMKVRRTLKMHSSGWKPSSSLPIIAQCSSIGSLGKDSRSWFDNELGVSLSGGMDSSGLMPSIKVIYPSEDDVRWSTQGYMGGSCLPYHSTTHQKQTWLVKYLNNWTCDVRKRTNSMPHIKTYTRLSKTYTTAQYLLLTSSNLSKAAWGQLQKQNTQLFIRSYEAGVLFLPKFLKKTDAFDINEDYPRAYDLPLKPYAMNTQPWFADTRKSTPDILGNTYR